MLTLSLMVTVGMAKARSRSPGAIMKPISFAGAFKTIRLRIHESRVLHTADPLLPHDNKLSSTKTRLSGDKLLARCESEIKF